MLDAGLPEAGGDTEHPVHALADLRGAEPQGRIFPKRVAMMAKMSIILPNQPSTSLPKTGRSIGETRPALFRRWVE